MPSISDIISALEARVNPGYQEKWDNTGWQVIPCGRDAECTGVMVAVDVTPAVISEAKSFGCNLIVSHHPLIFRPLKRLVGATPAERMVIDLISEEIAVYSAHTSLDSVAGGISWWLASSLGLRDIKVLAPREESLLKMVTFVPGDYLDAVRNAVFEAGAGTIGDYDRCGFSVKGEGTFRPLDGSDPFVGTPGEDHCESEYRLEMIVPRHLRGRVEAALRQAHPYEEPAIDFFAVEISDGHSGLGAIGDLPAPMTAGEFIAKVKSVYGSPVVRTTVADLSAMVSRVALCGGSGGEFIGSAMAQGADVYVTSDVRYHDFVDHSSRILVVDTGHFESEKCAKELLASIISEKFANFAVRMAHTEVNSIQYH